MDKKTAFILWFDQLSIEDVPYTGGKNASLGEMYSSLTSKGVSVPNGFAVTAYAYNYLLDKSGIRESIKKALDGLDTSNMEDLASKGSKVRKLIREAEFPKELRDEIIDAYGHLNLQYGENTDVAVRSSATAEDLPDASFAGQQETYLNIKGPEELILSCKKCFASLFTNRAISYRVDKGFDHFSIGLSIGIQKMVRSDKASSGVMFSIDTESGFEDLVFVTSAYGLGENVVQGAVNPDEFLIFKPTLKQGKRAIISKKLGSKHIKMIYDFGGNKSVKNVDVDIVHRNKYAITDDEILTLSKWAVIIEDHYSKKAGHHKPMDMEWAKDGITGELFIVQARPETVHSQKDMAVLESFVLEKKGHVLVEGRSVGQKIGSGPVRIIRDVHNINEFKEGDVLVTEMTDPDWEPIMKIASAIVTNRGGRTCHAAIISRELGIPCIVGTENGTEKLQDKQEVTVDCSQGDEGFIYEGIIPFNIEKTKLDQLPKTKTKIMMNLANPDQAFTDSFIPNEGVGLARMEFIINSYIKAHPLALINFDNLEDENAKKQIEELTNGYENKTDFFVDNLAFGVAKIAAAFYPKKVILRLSDFKSNEYANLIGGKQFEPIESNPMIGWRGASRYYKEGYREGFALECKAIKRVREDFGLTNLELMIPICRTVSEGKKVLAEMEKNGLKKGEDGLKVNVMCEVPSNVLLADKFLEIFDGFSIGSNDLTQFTLACDRDSELVADIYDERNEAVKRLISQVIKVANEKNKYIGICGQGPSDYEDFAMFLVQEGIHSMSLNPDTIIKTTLKIAEKEKELGISPDK
ncbi:MAG: phosphoenolpyruvate synthase [Patescibacteria group bacterium]|nr:phosphoenolpyruvate synthase [Patescibacteria group bacterium]